MAAPKTSQGRLRQLLEEYAREFVLEPFDFDDVATVEAMADERKQIARRSTLLSKISNSLPHGSSLKNTQLLAVALLVGWVQAGRGGDDTAIAGEPSQRDVVDALERAVTGTDLEFPFSVTLYDDCGDFEEGDSWEVGVEQASMPFRTIRLKSSLANGDDGTPTNPVTLSGQVLVPNSLAQRTGFEVVQDLVRTVVGASIALGLSAPPTRSWLTGGERLRGRIPVTVGERTQDLRAEIAGVVLATRFISPEDPSELEKRAGSFQVRARPLARLLEREPTIPLATATRLLFESFATADAGLSMSLAFTAIEAALLEKTNTEKVTERLKEAVTYRLGVSSESRNEIRDLVEILYKERSNFVHTGGGSLHASAAAVRLAGWVLRRELMDLR